MQRFIYSLALGLLWLTSTATAADILHQERSVYSNVLVKKTGSRLCLMFSVRHAQRNQSCMDTRNPQKMVFAYTKMSLAGLLFVPDPTHILIIGLGGGTLPTAFAELFPTAKIDAVEIDPAVTRVARDFFGFVPTDNTRVFDQDARVWTKRAVLRPRRYDIIILDAFNGEYIPEHLMTEEYLRETKSLLSPGGILMANTFSISELYDHESVTYQKVFGTFINFKVAESANRMVVVPAATLSDDDLKKSASLLVKTLQPYDVPIRRFARLLIKQRRQRPDWNQHARVLTDQYAPANLLQSR